MAEAKNVGWLINTCADNDLDKWFTILLPSFMEKEQVIEALEKECPSIFGYNENDKITIYATRYKAKSLVLTRFDGNA